MLVSVFNYGGSTHLSFCAWSIRFLGGNGKRLHAVQLCKDLDDWRPEIAVLVESLEKRAYKGCECLLHEVALDQVLLIQLPQLLSMEPFKANSLGCQHQFLGFVLQQIHGDFDFKPELSVDVLNALY